MADASPADEERALRLTFTYRGDEIELVDAQQVAMFVPPGDARDDRSARSGFWIELRDGAEGVVFRQDLHHPVTNDHEVFPEDPYGEIVRQPVASRSGAFTLVVPEAVDAASVVLVASPARAEERNQAASEVARFDMADVRRRARDYGRS